MSSLIQINKNQLDLYCIFLSSRWFNSLDDYINLEFVCSKYNGNMTKFFYNPLPIDEQIIKFFPNIRTQYLYSKSDKMIVNETIQWYNFIYKIGYLEWKEMKEIHSSISDYLKFDKIIFTKEDRKQLFLNSRIKEYSIPEEIVEIDDNAFENYYSLTSIKIPTSVTKIGNYCFNQCSYLKEIIIPTSVKEIGYCFLNRNCCLTSLKIPDSVTKLNPGCLVGCTNLKQITLPESKTIIKHGKEWFNDQSHYCRFVLPKIFNNSDERYKAIINIPTYVTSLGDFYFFGIHRLTKYTVPKNISSLGDYAFARCTNLSSIKLHDQITHIGDSCFLGCSSLKTVTIPSGITQLNNSWFNSCLIEKIILPSSITRLSDGCFKEYKKLQSISIPSTIKSFGSYCFQNCESLQKLTIPSTVTSLGEYCFASIHNLENITIPLTIKSIPNYCFYNCRFFERITIPTSVTSFGEYAFANCFFMQLEIPSTVKEIGKGCFMGCRKIDTHSHPLIEQSLKQESRLTDEQISLLEEWTGKQFSIINYDNEIEDKNDPMNDFHSKICMEKTFYLIFETDDRIVFGIYCGEGLRRSNGCLSGRGPNRLKDTFLFTFKDNIPMKFEKRNDIETVEVTRYVNSNCIIESDTIDIYLSSACRFKDTSDNREFDFKGLEYPLIGRKEAFAKRVFMLIMKDKN